jgi:hypothetical protein
MDHDVRMSGDAVYVVAGFVAAHRWLPPASFRSQGLPPEVVSVSECVTHFHPHDQEPMSAPPWHLTLDEALDAAGDDAGCVVEPPATTGIGRLRNRVTKRRPETVAIEGTVHTLSMSAPATDADDLIALMPRHFGGHPHLIMANLALGAAAPAGRVLEFEVLGFDEGRFHTWFCRYMHTGAAERLGIVPNEHGLIGTLAEARAVSDGERDDETALWFPALIMQHDRVPGGAAASARSSSPPARRSARTCPGCRTAP